LLFWGKKLVNPERLPKKIGYALGDFPQAERYYDRALSIPFYPKMEEKDTDYVIENLTNLLHKN